MTVIRVENISKLYKLGVVSTGTLRDDLAIWFAKIQGKESPLKKVGASNALNDKESDGYVWSLKDISFDVKQGEVVGVIGKNGAGKSTLLKILSKITSPTHGRIHIKGRIASLLEVGTGFHSELTGRENIYLNGAILGMTKREIKSKIDEIVEFSGISKYIDTPVKRYSSGMTVRLGFAVAAHLEPEILIVDEVLAVGDAEFQKKCLGKMKDVSVNEGRTVIFVSHNMAAVENLCDRAILLDKGSVFLDSNVKSVTDEYARNNIYQTKTQDLLLRDDRKGSGLVRISKFHLENIKGEVIDTVKSDEPVYFVIGYHCDNPEICSKVDIGYSVHLLNDTPLSINYSSFTNFYYDNLSKKGVFKCLINKLNLTNGSYLVYLRVLVNNIESDWVINSCGVFDVILSESQLGYLNSSGYPFIFDANWK
jgi:lipopolysaccharide transport system ATP-binding protein